jgi:hypothetical protein
MRPLFTLALLAALLGGPTGCKQEVLCPSLGDCGGPPPLGIKPGADGDWVLAPGHPSCTEDLYVPAGDTRLIGGNIPTTGTPYPEPAVFDWCVLLVTGPVAGGQIEVKPPRFYYESGPIGFATLKFQADGHFSTGITRTGTFTLDFPTYCIRAFGAMDNRPTDPTDPKSLPVNVCKQLEVPLASSGIGEGSYHNSTCDPNTDELRARYGLDGPADPGGCLCRFDVDETGGPAGTYIVQQDRATIVDFPDAVASNFPQKTTYCARGDDLKLTGADGLYLFDQKGLRTMDLVRGCKDPTDCVSGNCVVDSTSGRGVCQ